MTEATPEPWHGTIKGYYSRKCRCADCREAARRYYHEKVKTSPRKPCEVEGCTKLARLRNRTCDGHYKRLRATGSVGTPETLVLNFGENPGYWAAHKRLVRSRGRAKQYPCSVCGERRAKDWAYLHGNPGEQPAGVTASGKTSRAVLSRPCALRADVRLMPQGVRPRRRRAASRPGPPRADEAGGARG